MVGGRGHGSPLRAQDVDLCVASAADPPEGLEPAQLLDEAVGVAMPLDHPLAGRTSVSIDELADQSFVTARKGHWQRRLLDRLFAARDLTPKIVCEVDEPSAIADLIGAGLGIGLVPAFARRTATVPVPPRLDRRRQPRLPSHGHPVLGCRQPPVDRRPPDAHHHHQWDWEFQAVLGGGWW